MKNLYKAGAVLSLITTLHAGGEGWTSDFKAAKAQAAKEGKDLLIDFTGSDWCGWCIKLNKEVFKHDAFKNGVKDKFVLVELDFPRDKSKLDEATQAQNKELGEKYGVRGYPTILLTDAEGRPYAKTGYRRGGPEAYVTHLDEFQASRIKRDESFAAAAKLEGVEKAKALVAALKELSISDTQVAEFYAGTVEQIKAADPEDASGYIKGIDQKKRMSEFGKKLNELASKQEMDAALKLVDDTMAAEELDAPMTQRMHMTKGMILAGMERFDEAIAQMDKALEADPEGAGNQRIKTMRMRLESAKRSAAKPDKPAEPKPKADKAPDEKAPDIKEGVKEPVRARDK